MKLKLNIFSVLIFSCLLALNPMSLAAQHDGQDHETHEAKAEHGGDSHGTHEMAAQCSEEHSDEYNHMETLMGHIGDANEFHIVGDLHLPLPCILYAPDHGFSFFMSNKLGHGHHHIAYDRYVMNHGRINRIADASFPMGEQAVSCVLPTTITTEDGKKKEAFMAVTPDGHEYVLEGASALDGGLIGGGFTSYYDFSITKNVFVMFLGVLLLFFVFLPAARGYKRNEGKAPSGIQALIEPIFLFMRDDVVRPMIGEKHYEKYLPFILSLFFFILFANLLGLIPFFPGSANITGNLAVTMALAIVTFFVVNLNGNKDYWEHILWMPGIPPAVKFLLTPIEILGLFIKPFALMIRLFANISAGHIIIISLVGLIFIFGQNGASLGGGITGAFLGGAFTLFMNMIELIVAFIQAFIFALLTSSYIGAAVEEHGHEEAH